MEWRGIITACLTDPNNKKVKSLVSYTPEKDNDVLGEGLLTGSAYKRA